MWPVLPDRLRARFRGPNTLRQAGVMGVLGACLAAPVCAGNFSVTPVRIYMATNERASAITVNNDGDEELVMQADDAVPMAGSPFAKRGVSRENRPIPSPGWITIPEGEGSATALKRIPAVASSG